MSLLLTALISVVACDAGGSATQSPGDADVSHDMFEANAAEQRGDQATANAIYLKLCLQKRHVEACTQLEDEAESDPELKRKLCHEANHTPAC